MQTETGCYGFFNHLIPLCQDCEVRIDCQLTRVETRYGPINVNRTYLQADDTAYAEWIKKMAEDMTKTFRDWAARWFKE